MALGGCQLCMALPYILGQDFPKPERIISPCFRSRLAVGVGETGSLSRPYCTVKNADAQRGLMTWLRLPSPWSRHLEQSRGLLYSHSQP